MVLKMIFFLWIIICKKYSIVFFFFSFVFFLFGIFILLKDKSLIFEYNILYFNSSWLRIVILLDWISLFFIRFVIFISSIVIFYRNEYIIGDLKVNRFILLVVIFVISIILLIIRPNLISILLGWDGLGLVSYCLVIYYQNVKSYNAGMLTALRNRIGDVALLISIAWILNYGSWNFLFYVSLIKNDFEIIIISFLVVLAAITKSAQIPFSSWLPAAIAAPTPVSSLVHSSTLVTAGVYLLIRFRPCLGSEICYLLLFFRRITIFISGLGANYEFDLKKIIALSTLRQLGLIIRILCLGEYKLAFFHLLTHALFKALLFMCSGLIIHNLNSTQDIRFIGGLINHIPITISIFCICNFSLCGLPFLRGFYSKDLIVEVLSIRYLNIYIYVIYYLSVGLTVCYRFRLSHFLIFGDYNFFILRGLVENNEFIIKGIKGLIILVVFIGRLLRWLIFFEPFYICLPLILKLITLNVILIGVWIGSIFFDQALNYKFKSKFKENIWEFLGSIWNIPYISTSFINKPVLIGGSNYYKFFDHGWLEFYGKIGLTANLKYLTIFFQFLSINYFKSYFILMTIWIIFFIINIYLNSL